MSGKSGKSKKSEKSKKARKDWKARKRLISVIFTDYTVSPYSVGFKASIHFDVSILRVVKMGT